MNELYRVHEYAVCEYCGGEVIDDIYAWYDERKRLVVFEASHHGATDRITAAHRYAMTKPLVFFPRLWDRFMALLTDDA